MGVRMNSPVPHVERAGLGQTRGYFEHDADIGIIGGGTTVEQAFEAAAQAVFGIVTDLDLVEAAINCALANRQILTRLARSTFMQMYPHAELETLFDVSHNTCKVETHDIDGELRSLYLHRKGATRAFGPGHQMLPERDRAVGQPVVIGGSMGTGSYILAGASGNPAASSSRGAGRAMSRHQALARWKGRALVDELARQGILIRNRSMRGVAEEAPGAYKDVDLVAEATEQAGLARRVAFLRPKVCVKG
jgi:tRNA-splicing ligase RtcB (3'-phosphate/5'-hydroxy nucleic acid ligase)